jgi:hypothetical protein
MDKEQQFDAAARVADFVDWIEHQRREGFATYWPIPGRLPWDQASETYKLGEIVWSSWVVEHGHSVAGAAALAAVEQFVDYAGLPASQREMLIDLRERLDAGRLIDPPGVHEDRVGMALSYIWHVSDFEKRVGELKASEDRPWANVPEAVKVELLVDAAQGNRAPAGFVLEAIEREVDFRQLPTWRREALEGLRDRIGPPGIDARNPQPSYLQDDAGYALQMAELEALVEEYKQLGAPDADGRRWPWNELSEEQKLSEIQVDIANLDLEEFGRAYELVDREVDMTRVPDWQRQSIERHREEAGLPPRAAPRAVNLEAAGPGAAPSDYDRMIAESMPAPRPQTKDRNQDIDL